VGEVVWDNSVRSTMRELLRVGALLPAQVVGRALKTDLACVKDVDMTEQGCAPGKGHIGLSQQKFNV